MREQWVGVKAGDGPKRTNTLVRTLLTQEEGDKVSSLDGGEAAGQVALGVGQGSGGGWAACTNSV